MKTPRSRASYAMILTLIAVIVLQIYVVVDAWRHNLRISPLIAVAVIAFAVLLIVIEVSKKRDD